MENYLSSIMWFLGWPILIFISYKVVFFAVKSFEKSQPKEN
jgi:hypothetical protein